MSILEPVLQDIGMEDSENDDFPILMIRNDILKQECRVNHPGVIKHMQEKLELWLENPEYGTKFIH